MFCVRAPSLTIQAKNAFSPAVLQTSEQEDVLNLLNAEGEIRLYISAYIAQNTGLRSCWISLWCFT